MYLTDSVWDEPGVVDVTAKITQAAAAAADAALAAAAGDDV
jgi:hypothetical protein